MLATLTASQHRPLVALETPTKGPGLLGHVSAVMYTAGVFTRIYHRVHLHRRLESLLRRLNKSTSSPGTFTSPLRRFLFVEVALPHCFRITIEV